MEKVFNIQNSNYKDKKDYKCLTKNHSFNIKKKKIKLSNYNSNKKPSNLNYVPCFKKSSIKGNNKEIRNKCNLISREYYTDRNKSDNKIKKQNVNNTLNDIYDTINNINKLNIKIQTILLNSPRRIKSISTNRERRPKFYNYLGEKNTIIRQSKNYSNPKIIKDLRRNKFSDNNIFINRNNDISNGQLTSKTNNINHDKNNKLYLNEYNSSIFIKPEYNTISNKRNNKKDYFYKYKNNLLKKKELEKDNDNNYLSDYESVLLQTSNLSNFSNEQNFDDIKFNMEDNIRFDNIKNMKLKLNNINKRKFKKISEEEKELSCMAKQIESSTENEIKSSLTKRAQNMKDIILLEKYKQIEFEKLHEINDIKNNNIYNFNYNNNYNYKLDNYEKIENKNKTNEDNCIFYNQNNYLDYNKKSPITYNFSYDNLKIKKNINNLNNNNGLKNDTNYYYNNYFKVNNENKIINKDNNIYKDEDILKNKNKDLFQEIYDYKNSKNIFRHNSFNKDKNNNIKDVNNIQNNQNKLYFNLKEKIPSNNNRISNERNYNNFLGYKGNSYTNNYNYNYDYSYK